MADIIICIRHLSQLKNFVKNIKSDQSNNFVFVVDIHSNGTEDYFENYKNTIEELTKLKKEENTVSVIFNSCYSSDKENLKTDLQNPEVQVTCLGAPEQTVLPLELFLSFFQNKVPTSDQSSQLLKPASEEEEKELNDLLETYKSLKLVAYQSCSTTTNNLLIDSKHALLAIAYAEHNPENQRNFLQVAEKILSKAGYPIKNHLEELQALLKENPVEGGETDHLNLFTILKEHQNNAVILKKVLEYASAIGKEEGERYFWRKAIEVVPFNIFEQILPKQNWLFGQKDNNLSDLIRYALSNRTNQQEEIITSIFDTAQDPKEVFDNAINNLQEQHKKQKLNKYLQTYRNNSADNTSKSCIDCLPLQFLLDSAKEWRENLPSSMCCCCTAKPMEEQNELKIGTLGNGL